MFKKIALLAFVALGVGVSNVAARDYVIALPEVLSREQAEKLWRETDSMILNDLQRGEGLFVYNASKPELVAEFRVPDKAGMENPRRRRRALGEPFKLFGSFVKEYYLNGPSENAAEGEHILIPQLLSEISGQRFGGASHSDRDVCVLLVGSALHRDKREPSFDMVGGYFPSDGHIVASQARSIYGTADKQGQLQGVNLHLLYTNQDWASDVHRLRVHRTWFLFAEAQDGVLASFTPDAATALSRFRSCNKSPGRTFAWDSSRSAMAMIHVTRTRRQDENDELVSQQTNGESTNLIANDDWLRSDEVSIASEAPTVDRGALKLGIRWGDDDGCASSDIDLHIRSSPNRPYLYFSQNRTADGVYHKDFTSAPGTRNGLEYVDITDAVSLRNLDIRINHYAGSCPGGAHGVVRAYFNGAAYEYPFQIEADEGNRGGNRSRAEYSKHWVVVDPKSLFHLGS